MNVTQKYLRWKKCVPAHTPLSDELCAIEHDSAAIEDRFYCELDFGTGGLRGILGAGTNRMNIYTVARATQGYSNYLLRHFEQPAVAIAYDSRIGSDIFSETAATVFAANKIHVHLYPRLMPTPALSFAVRDLHCSGGVVITASHNPAQYNGYKIYAADGCQITTEAAKAIKQEIDAVDVFDDVHWCEFDAALSTGEVSYIQDDTVDRYINAVSAVSVLPKEIARDISIVYTPLNGTGISCVPRCLKEQGFTHITIPTEQAAPDGNFPTCPYPNPEIREALTVGLSWAERIGGDLLLATDPDCDRVGVAVKNGGGYVLINGNEMGVLLLDFICKMRIAQGTMPASPMAYKTIVTAPMAAKVAKRYGVELEDVLTGFKFIGEQIGLLERKGEAERFVFGFEESYGYLSGSFVRDKDGVNASLLICEMFAWYQAQEKSLPEVLEELYSAYGYYQNRMLTFTFEGSAGSAKMQSFMRDLREKPPQEIVGRKIDAIGDYYNSIKRGPDGKEEPICLPKSNVLRYFLSDGAEVVVRPSGTEPKLKIYITAIGETKEESVKTAGILENYIKIWVRSAENK